MNGWTPRPLGEIAVINPREKLERGTVAPFLPMTNVAERWGGVKKFDSKEFTGGGARFRSGDVLVARITPCLENGKIARVGPDLGDGVGHGSTEFLVVRGVEGVADTSFLHYCLATPAFLNFAVPQMTGTSGRQRLSADRLAAYPVALPPLNEQRRIAEALTTLSSLAAIDVTLADRLDDRLQAHWASVAERTRRTAALGDLIALRKGVSYKGEFLSESGLPLMNLGSFGLDGRHQPLGIKHYTGPVKESQRLKAGDLIVSNTDLTQQRDILGRPLLVPYDVATSTHHTFQVAVPDGASARLWIYCALRTEAVRQRLISYASGTTVASLPADALLTQEIPWPSASVLTPWGDAAAALLRAEDEHRREAARLTAAVADLSEPLMAGHIRLP